jgi:hypothetical protein
MHPRTRNSHSDLTCGGQRGIPGKRRRCKEAWQIFPCTFRSYRQLVLCYISNGFLLVHNSPTVEMESPKDESCFSNCTSPTVYTPDPVPTPTNLDSLSPTNSSPHVDERFRRRAISGLLCFFAVGWGDASGYTLSFCFLRLINHFSHWGGSPLHPRGILS